MKANGRVPIPQRSLVHSHGASLLGHFNFLKMRLSLVVQVNHAGQELIASHGKNYDHEKKLHKEVKEEEFTKFGHDRKSKLLQKQEDENNDWTKAEKIRLSVESLKSEILRLQHSISTTCSCIVKLIDN